MGGPLLIMRMSSQQAQRGDRGPLAIQDHVRRIKVHANIGVQRIEEPQKRLSRLLTRLQRDRRSDGTEDRGNVLNPLQHRVARPALMRQEPGVKRDQRQAQPLRHRRVGLRRRPVRLPMLIRQQTTGPAQL